MVDDGAMVEEDASALQLTSTKGRCGHPDNGGMIS